MDDQDLTIGADAAGDEPPSSTPGRIGSYRLLRVIGQGGMGVVYEAEQENPRRTVALKVIRPGLASAPLLRRFEHEAQILGRLQHPGIAQIHEAGTADSGHGPQPYFAMELVRGLPLLDFASVHSLGARERLELLAKVCDAVDYAHCMGVIHRDLKPANIVVSDQPKILDFGIARATDADVQATTVLTDIGEIIGTLPYMSPEQVAGDPADVDARCDVYALGVIAYELLTGRLPLALAHKSLPEAARLIREEEPTRLSAIDRTLRGDVETIVAKALDKDKARRYRTAGELASDIRRHLRNEPIVARPPSTLYQLGKFARRNRGLVIGLAAVFVALVLGTIVSTGQAVRARRAELLANANLAKAVVARESESRQRALADSARTVADGERRHADEQRAFAQTQERLAEEARDRATTEATRSAQTTAFLQSMLKGVDPATARGRDTALLRSILDETARRIDRELAGQPDVQAEIRKTLGSTYRSIDQYAASDSNLAVAIAIDTRLHGADDPRTLSARGALGWLRLSQGRHAEAESLFTAALAAAHRLPAGAMREDDLLDLYDGCGSSLGRLGHYAEANQILTEGAARFAWPDSSASETKLALMADLALYSYTLRHPVEAETVFRQIIDVRRRRLGSDHPRTLLAQANLAIVLNDAQKFAEAESLNAVTVAGMTRTYGPEHAQTLKAMNNLAYSYVLDGKYAVADSLNRHVLEIRRRVLGPEHPETLYSMNNLGDVLMHEGKYAEADSLIRRALAIRRRTLGENHHDTLLSVDALGRLLKAQHRNADAAPFLKQYADILGAEFGEHSVNHGIGLYNWAATLQDAGEDSASEMPLRQAIAMGTMSDGRPHPYVGAAWTALARVYLDRKDYARADSLVRAGLAVRHQLFGDKHEETARSQEILGELQIATKDYRAADSTLRACVATRQAVLPAGDWQTAAAQSLLGAALTGESRYAAAESLLVACWPVVKESEDAKAIGVTSETVARFVALYDAWKRPADRDSWVALQRYGSGPQSPAVATSPPK